MTLWHISHIRNEIVHDKRRTPMESSQQFLLCYMDSLLLAGAGAIVPHFEKKNGFAVID
jgi:hypothetical protein